MAWSHSRRSLSDGVKIHAIGGDQVLMCRVVYEPGTAVTRHLHADTEQVDGHRRG